jgi:hypothetical protein
MASTCRRFLVAASLGLAVVGLSAGTAPAQYIYSRPVYVSTRLGTPTFALGVTAGAPVNFRPSPSYSPLNVPGSPGAVQYGPVMYTTPTTVIRPYTTYNSLSAGPALNMLSPFATVPLYTPPVYYTPSILFYP